MEYTDSLLIVDDNPNNLDLLSRRLEKSGYAITRAENGQQALNLLKTHTFDLMLLDIMMPDINGLEVLKIIRQTHAFTQLPIIMATALDESETHVEALKLGANDFVTKPYDFPVILARVQTHLSLKKAEAALQASHNNLEHLVTQRTAELCLIQERLQTVIEHLPYGVSLLDENRQVVLTNANAKTDLKALSGGHCESSVVTLGDRSMEEILAKKTELTIKNPAHQTFHIESAPFKNGGHVLITRDITQEKLMQERVKKHEHLAAVGQLAAGIAHDFNNMLTVMMGVSQILTLRDDLSEELKSDMNNIYEQGQRAAQLVRQVLDFSRATQTTRQTIDIVPFMKENIKLIERTFPSHIQIQMDNHMANCLVLANPTKLQQVLTNLVINARDAMPQGGKLRIGLAHLHVPQNCLPPLPEMPSGMWIVWTISDTGTGMPPDVQAHIFEPFFTTKPREQGTGLGLSQVYGIVKQHDGFIDVASQEGEGTTFTIYLPQSAAEQTPDNQPQRTLPRGQRQTILVVEDKPEVRRVVTGLLNALNYQTLVAATASEALSICTNDKPVDLVLTDYMLTDMTGSQLFLKLQTSTPSIPVLIMTGSSANDGSAILMPEGIMGILQKPLLLPDVAHALHHALSQQICPT